MKLGGGGAHAPGAPPVPTPMTWTQSGGYISEHKSQLVLFPLLHFADKTEIK